jgi:hypothetical protein
MSTDIATELASDIKVAEDAIKGALADGNIERTIKDLKPRIVSTDHFQEK